MAETIQISTLRRTLRRTFGFRSLREGQEEVIRSIVEGKDTLVIMPTGAGKSLCYQLPGAQLPGTTIVVSPLLSLMKDQVDKLQELGIGAAQVNSTLTTREETEVLEGIEKEQHEFVFVTPERLAQPGFLDTLKTNAIDVFVIDEAHCISQWGHDFRPSYLRLREAVEALGNPPVLALTATATPEVVDDILRQLGREDMQVISTGVFRENLRLEVIRAAGEESKLHHLARLLGEIEGTGIVYTSTVKDCEAVTDYLEGIGFDVARYHGRLGGTERHRNQDRFMAGELKAVVATNAFGMGIDKPNVRFVIHTSLPKTIASYYQETGRAGRDGLPSDCLLLYGAGDRMRHLQFIFEKSDAADRQYAQTQLEEMAAFAETGECRRIILLRHFGEEYQQLMCGGCDNCVETESVEIVDATTMTQMFLSTAVRLRQSFGAAYIIDILRGSQSRKILNNRHTELSTYGIGADKPREEWRWLASALIAEGYAKQRVDAYGAIGVTPSGWDVLKNAQTVVLKRRREAVQEKATTEKVRPGDIMLPIPNRRLMERLRALRKAIANRLDVPPFVILGDRTLQELSATLPADRDALARVHGFGEVKIERHGDEFLNAIADALAEDHELTPIAPPKPITPPAASSRGSATRASATKEPAPKREKRPGPSDTVLATLALYRGGLSTPELVERRGLSLTTIENHLEELVAAGEIPVEDLVTPEKIETIRAAFAEHGDGLLKPVREALGDGYEWIELRAVRAYDLRMAALGEV
jgi:ATP-dependent DNA helicase RecQ